MLRGLYTAAAGMISEQRRHDTITNNIANINSPGFKQGNALSRSFPEMLISTIRGGQGASTAPIGKMSLGVFSEESISLHAQGDLQETQNPFDFALVSKIQVPGMSFDASGKFVDANGQRTFQPQALFTVLNANGEQRYSLNGKFTVDTAGQLVNANGNLVLGRDGQPLLLIDGAGQPIHSFKVTDKGEFIDANGLPLLGPTGQPVGLMLSRAENPNLLLREGNGLLRINPGDEATVTQVAAGDQVQVRQGFIERSNVDSAQSMVDMMSALRAYEANQKVIQSYDKSMEKAANEVGRV
ncbi:flagellar hook-basal body protein [Paenibacillus alginolyticus]|uniref:Flagellar hook-basal body protein n=1 Tax=Paenibacillus alginolyticus TaxID=59839 RepID=A0ABT4GGU3_9BACL|nr:flagellar hook-basal body protein [Paenibacillus alginolyticus]MCY9666835.1 flagellar hook-basal body protein [Paenibacillus alginolyticus]MCY9695411.1 flagellar hook-basal body protein [Paenibacillus alginolyticus]MEC0145336.1 flagellar hook-basal body protein [Paenibacillus alginolyticus]